MTFMRRFIDFLRNPVGAPDKEPGHYNTRGGGVVHYLGGGYGRFTSDGMRTGGWLPSGRWLDSGHDHPYDLLDRRN